VITGVDVKEPRHGGAPGLQIRVMEKLTFAV
jgi:hypothetical protein